MEKAAGRAWTGLANSWGVIAALFTAGLDYFTNIPEKTWFMIMFAVNLLPTFFLISICKKEYRKR